MNIYQFIYACRKGQIDQVKYLVKQGADIHANNNEALRLASKYGKYDVVKYLVENGAANNDKALRLASKYGHIHIVKYLVEQGAVDIHARDKALRLAGEYGHIHIVKYLLSSLLISNFLLHTLNKKKKSTVLSELVMAVVYKNRFLKTIFYPRYASDVCPICREDVVYKHVLKCGHVYHSKCIKAWSETKKASRCCYNCS